MHHSIRTALLNASAALMLFGASGIAFVFVPDLHGDLVEIGVRRSVLGGTGDVAIGVLVGAAVAVPTKRVSSSRRASQSPP